MPESRPPDLEMFVKQFRLKYGRDMTPEERHFYQLTKNLLDNPPAEERNEAESETA